LTAAAKRGRAVDGRMKWLNKNTTIRKLRPATTTATRHEDARDYDDGQERRAAPPVRYTLGRARPGSLLPMTSGLATSDISQQKQKARLAPRRTMIWITAAPHPSLLVYPSYGRPSSLTLARSCVCMYHHHHPLVCTTAFFIWGSFYILSESLSVCCICTIPSSFISFISDLVSSRRGVGYYKIRYDTRTRTWIDGLGLGLDTYIRTCMRFPSRHTVSLALEPTIQAERSE